MTRPRSAVVIKDQLEGEHGLLQTRYVVMDLDAFDFLQIMDPPRRHRRETLGGNILRRSTPVGLKRAHKGTLARHHGLRKVRADQIGNVIDLDRRFAPARGRELDRLGARPDLPRRDAPGQRRPTRILETTALALLAQNNGGGARVAVAGHVSRRTDGRGTLMGRNAAANVAGKPMGPGAQRGGTGLLKVDLSHDLVPLIFDFFKKSLVIWGHRGLERCAVRTASPSRGSRRLFSST